MQVNMAGRIECEGKQLENVAEFKYLGLIVNRSKNSPEIMLEARTEKAIAAFNTVRSNSRILGLHNTRVRI
jgi:hypothetical protein